MDTEMATSSPLQPNPDVNKQIAVHEAGHALFAYVTGIYELTALDINDSRRAITTYKTHQTRALQRALLMDLSNPIAQDHELAVIAAAGIEAERLWLQRNNYHVEDEALEAGARGDRYSVQARLPTTPDVWDIAKRAAADYLIGNSAWYDLIVALSCTVIEMGGVLRVDLVMRCLVKVTVSHHWPQFKLLVLAPQTQIGATP
jgi:hypothetical protein